MPYPQFPGKHQHPPLWTPKIFLEAARAAGWDPGPILAGCVITWQGDRRLAAQPDEPFIGRIGEPVGPAFESVELVNRRELLEDPGAKARQVAAELFHFMGAENPDEERLRVVQDRLYNLRLG